MEYGISFFNKGLTPSFIAARGSEAACQSVGEWNVPPIEAEDILLTLYYYGFASFSEGSR